MIAAAGIPTAAAIRKSNGSTVMMFFSMPKVPGPRQRSAFDRLSKVGGLSLRSEGGVNSTKLIRESRPVPSLAEHRSDLSKAAIFATVFV
jgi:hypothetical protein